MSKIPELDEHLARIEKGHLFVGGRYIQLPGWRATPQSVADGINAGLRLFIEQKLDQIRVDRDYWKGKAEGQ